MSEKAQNELNNNPDELLKSALSVHLSDALPTKEEEVRHAFSVDFAIRIRDLISEADKLIAENEAEAEQSAEAELAADNGSETEDGIEGAAAGSAEHISAAGVTAGAAMSAAAEAQAAERSADTPENGTPHAETTAAQPSDDAAKQSEKVARIQEYQSKSREAAGKGSVKSKAEPEERIAPETAQRPEASAEALSDHSDNFSRAADRAPKTGRGRSRAEAAQDRMNRKILPASFLQRHRRAIVNAASLVLVVGIGAFFLKEGGSLLGGGAKSAAPGSEQSTAAAAEKNGAQTFSAPVASGETEADAAGNETGAQALTKDEAGLPNSGEHAGTGTAQVAPDTEGEARDSAAVPQAASETGGSAANGGDRTEQSAQSANASGSAGNSGQTGKKQSSSGRGTSGKTTRESAARTKGNLPEAGTAGDGTAAQAAESAGAAPSGNTGAAGAQEAVPSDTAAAHNGAAAGTAGALSGGETGAEAPGAAANGGAGLQETETGTGTADGTQLPNPIKEVKDPAEFETQLGFAFSVYPEASEQTETQYSVIADKVAQISYFSEAIDSKMTYRAERKEDLLAELPEQEREPGEAELSEDAWRLLSGIYYPFNPRRTEFWTVRGKSGAPDIPVTVRIVQSPESNGALATWEKDGILYTLWAEDASRHRNEVGREAKRLVELTNEQAPLR